MSTLPAPLPNSSFSSAQALAQFAWDSTSLGELKTCPRKYYYSTVLGMVPKSLSPHLFFGLAYHSALEHYDRRLAEGQSHQDALYSSLRHALQYTWIPGIKRGWASDIPEKTRFTLIRTVLYYLDEFGETDPAKTIILGSGQPAVELSFRTELGFNLPSGEAVLLCGHLDRLVTFLGDPWVMDRKTTKHYLDDRYYSQFTPHNQFTLYATASKIVYSTPTAGVLVDAAQVLATLSRFDRRPILRTEFQMEEFLQETQFYVQQAYYFAQHNFWPQNDKACDNFGGCPYRGVCSKGGPNARAEWLRAGFVQRAWNPLEVRGDI